MKAAGAGAVTVTELGAEVITGGESTVRVTGMLVAGLPVPKTTTL